MKVSLLLTFKYSGKDKKKWHPMQENVTIYSVFYFFSWFDTIILKYFTTFAPLF